MAKTKKCSRCGSLILPHEIMCGFCFIDKLNKSKKVVDKILK